ncbi:MAG: phage antirepressor KilAC domain-containing protein [Ruminococcus sp.]|nr:phage antirepressor KilAC domain-containing protein [Ruminococcus sp.]
MNNEIQVFVNDLFGSVRILTQNDGKVMFCGSDVAKALGYSNSPDAISKHCKKDGIAKCDSVDSIGRKNTLSFITEGNLYRLITHSKLPDAEKFEKWVFNEVLPSVRKHGAYMTDQVLEKALLSPDYLIKIATQLKKEQDKRRELETAVEEMRPKAGYYDAVLHSKSLFSVKTIADNYGWSSQKMNEYLRGKGVQYKQGKMWHLYAEYKDKGYTGTRTYSVGDIEYSSKTMSWTEKGFKFIYELLKSDGILPVTESLNVAFNENE